MNNSQTRHTSHLFPIGAFFLCAILIAVACYATFENFKASEIKDTNKTLASVGQLKTNQIQSYLSERKYDAAVVMSFLTTPSAQYWLTHQGGSAPVILNQLAESVVTAYQYRGLLLIDADANIRLNTVHSGILTETGKAIALHAMRERSTASYKIYFGDSSTPDEPVLDTFVPVMSPDGTTAVGVIVLRNELKFLFQLLQAWPVESNTAETLLVTKDGSDVLFLNEPRHHKDAAARLRVPLSTDTNAIAWPAISAVTGQFRLLEANDYRGKRVLAYTRAVSDTPWSMVTKMDMEEAIEHSQRLLRVAMIIAATFIVFIGVIAWLWWRKNKAGQLANKQLQESETRYRRLHESMMDAYVMTDMSGRFIEFNCAYQKMLGYSAEELLRLTYVDLTPEKWHELERRILEEQIIPHGKSQVYEKEYIRKDGTVFPLELRTFLLRDNNNQPEAMWAIVRDITERRQDEDTLRLHSEILENLSEGIFLIRVSDGTIVFTNPRFERMFGYEPGELAGKPVSIVNAPGKSNPEAIAAEIMNKLAQSGRWGGEVQNIRKDGTTFWCSASVSIFDHFRLGRVWVGIHKDITERKEAEQRMRELTAHLQTVREEEKASIAREIHDDLGGTLTALKMEAYWLADELSTSKESEQFLKHVELISQLTENAVNVTRRIITGLRPTVLDDLGLLAALEWQAAQFHNHTGIACRVNSIEDKAKLGRQCSIALFRIFQEALTNVARHSGATRVEVEFHCSDEEVMLSVSDDGRGLPDGHTVAPTSYGVRGMCERVEQLGGKIKFDSPAGGGFNVTVTLPLPENIKKEDKA